MVMLWMAAEGDWLMDELWGDWLLVGGFPGELPWILALGWSPVLLGELLGMAAGWTGALDMGVTEQDWSV